MTRRLLPTTLLMISLPVPPTTRPVITLKGPETIKKFSIQLPPAIREHASPKKRARAVGPGFSRKRSHLEHGVQKALPTLQGSSSLVEPLDSLSDCETDMPDFPVNLPTAPFMDEEGDLLKYSRAVFAGVVGLYQVCETLWMAQGWSSRSGASPVSAMH